MGFCHMGFWVPVILFLQRASKSACRGAAAAWPCLLLGGSGTGLRAHGVGHVA
jgi:hypothetical protein